MSSEGFLHRWSRLKRGAAAPDAVHHRGEEPGPAGDAGVPASDGGVPARDGGVAARDGGVAACDGGVAACDGGVAARGDTGPGAPSGTGQDSPPALPPIESLGPDADFTPFMQAGVDPAIRNAALARLFTDPRFNVMDGLDVYIDDYGKTEPIPSAILRGLEQARTLGLFDEPAQDPAPEVPPPAASAGPGREIPDA